ncbi:MAG TPA: acetylxylan esterase [Blastocatellia bacterium]|nr:acetylxylan esterase [Blastocatellia bacterium]
MPMHLNRPVRWFAAPVVSVLPLVSITLLIVAASPTPLLTRGLAAAQSGDGKFPPQVKFTGDGDHQNMMDQLGVKALRPGANPRDQTTFDEATANKYPLPKLMLMKNGTRVTKAKQWPARRAEIQEDFEREVYGRIPKHVPKVTWEVTNTAAQNAGGIPVITKTLVGHVDNSSYPLIKVDIEASVTMPANAAGPVPVMVEFGGGFRRGPGPPPWHEEVLSKGWGYGSINPMSIQADGPALTSGIIGLCNKGQPRKPDDWGSLRAWQWGVSRLLDYFETDKAVDARQVGIEGLSRYGKAALVTEAFEPRIAVGFIGSSGEGGAKLHRHIFGEAVENLTGGEYYWMAGNFMKYGASEATFGSKTAGDLPVDSHELIAMCAPRPCFISYGVVEKGDAKWVDAHGSFMAAVAAGPAYKLLGKRDLGTPGNYLTDQMPPVGQLIGGELAWRQHNGGHSVAENWPAFIEWASQFIKAPNARPTARGGA